MKESQKRDFRTAKKLDLSMTSDFFRDQGYEVCSINQVWRNVHAHLKKDSQSFFMKLATTNDIGLLLRNEASWNRQLFKRLSGNDQLFYVPSVIFEGKYQELPYYIGEFYPGQKLAEPNQPANSLGDWLDKIIQCTTYLLQTEGLQLVKDHERADRSPKEIIEGSKKHVHEWFGELLPPTQELVAPLLDSINLLDEYYRPATNHQDFVPWHMLEDRQRFILIDAEHASSQGPRFYDAVYFYHRLYTKGQSSMLANSYVEKLWLALSTMDRQSFIPTFETLLAGRIIGGFWDAKNDETSDVLHQELLQLYLDRSLPFMAFK
jgi:hypothetical protein